MSATTSTNIGHYHDPQGKYDYCLDPRCPRAALPVKKCSTVGCRRHATHVLTYSFQGSRDVTEQERVCEPCGEGYVRRPSLKAMLELVGQGA